MNLKLKWCLGSTCLVKFEFSRLFLDGTGEGHSAARSQRKIANIPCCGHALERVPVSYPPASLLLQFCRIPPTRF